MIFAKQTTFWALLGAVSLAGCASQLASDLHESALFDNPAKVQFFLDQGAEIDGKDEDGDTALSIAVSGGNLEIVSLLLAQGANPNVQDSSDDTPLHTALIFDHKTHNEAIIMQLLKFNASTDIANDNGVTPLHFAIEDLPTGSLSDQVFTSFIANTKQLNAVTKAGYNYYDLMCRDPKGDEERYLSIAQQLHAAGMKLTSDDQKWLVEQCHNVSKNKLSQFFSAL